MNHDSGKLSRRRLWLLAAVLLVAACGGVDSGGTGTGNGPLAPTLAVGAIAGFGSVIVNGVHYDDSQAAIADDDGRSLDRASLGLGMRTVVEASPIETVAGVPGAVAASITVRSDIVGPVQAVDMAHGVLTVLGQTVAVVPSTFFGGTMAAGLSALQVGEVVEVHATPDAATARFVASRIEGPVVGKPFKLRGPVASLSLAAKTVTIGAAVIAWSGVAPADPAQSLAPGRMLRVVLDTVPAAGVWHATALRAASAVLDDRDRVELEGRVSAVRSAVDFDLDGIRVDASGATVKGSGAGLVLGAKVEVKGSARGGVLIAASVQIEDDEAASEVELQGSIVSVDAAQQRFVVRGVTVEWSGTTRFDSSTAQDIRAGKRVEVHGTLSADGTVVEATSIHVES